VAPDNDSHNGFVACAWEAEEGGRRAVVVVNYQGSRGQCYLRLPFADLADRAWRLTDRTGNEAYERDGNTLVDPGLYIDLPAWGYNLFEIGGPP
jgi:hypothetical protein